MFQRIGSRERTRLSKEQDLAQSPRGAEKAAILLAKWIEERHRKHLEVTFIARGDGQSTHTSGGDNHGVLTQRIGAAVNQA